jgi:hypothetical protein
MNRGPRYWPAGTIEHTQMDRLRERATGRTDEHRVGRPYPLNDERPPGTDRVPETRLEH